MDKQGITELIEAAMEARENSYSPYSNYCVGAALKLKDGRIFKGCNIENAAFGPGDCAERNQEVWVKGNRDFEAIAIVGGLRGKELDMSYPCGICRQVMREFVDPDTFKIYVASALDNYEEYTLSDLLPNSFGPDNLG